MTSPPNGMTQALEAAFNQALIYAHALGHETLSDEHLLHSLVQDEQVAALLQSINVEAADLYSQIDNHLQTMSPNFYTRDRGNPPLRLIASGKDVLDTLDIFRALVRNQSSKTYAAYLISEYDITTQKVDKYMNNNTQPQHDVNDAQANEEKAVNSPFHPDFENNEIRKILGLEDTLKEYVIGQDEACEKLSKAFITAAAQDAERIKPIGSFLLNGPTGVGKTEIAKQLAKALGKELIRIDMSEYSESHSVARLVGSPPGYVGHDEGGQLTSAVAANPDAIILLDEVEKAHPKAHQMFLQIMDNGILTDSKGNAISFAQTTLLMTGNIGVTEAQKNTIGFVADEDTGARYTAELERTFSPEFINRLSAVVQFNGLSPDLMDKILNKMIGELNDKYTDTEIELDSAAKQDIADRGFHPTMGARPMERLLQSDIEDTIAKEILRSKLEDLKVNKVSITFNEAANDNEAHLDFAYSKGRPLTEEAETEEQSYQQASYVNQAYHLEHKG